MICENFSDIESQDAREKAQQIKTHRLLSEKFLCRHIPVGWKAMATLSLNSTPHVSSGEIRAISFVLQILTLRLPATVSNNSALWLPLDPITFPITHTIMADSPLGNNITQPIKKGQAQNNSFLGLTKLLCFVCHQRGVQIGFEPILIPLLGIALPLSYLLWRLVGLSPTEL